MRLVVPLTIVCSALVCSANADRVYWNAKGKVTDVMGTGLQGLVALDEEVDVEFSYDDGAIGIARGGFAPLYQTFDFRKDVELEMDISIGGLSWVGSIASGSSGTPLTFEVTDVETLFGTTETVSPTLSSAFGEVFSSFPGASAGGINELQVRFVDEESLYNSVFGISFEPVTEPAAEVGIGSVIFTPCEFTSGDGEIRAGGEKVSYTIDLTTLRISDGSPPPPASTFGLEIEWVGAEVQLDWEATVDRCYRIQWSNDLQIWNEVTGVVAQSEMETYSFVPVGTPGAQYYRVIQTD